jgi:tetratricopeptide (TPR) repeat protein
MDCRLSLRPLGELVSILRRALPAGCLFLAASAGCNLLQHQQLVKTPDGQTVALEKSADDTKDEEKRAPKPESLVAFADFRMHAANEANRPQAVQEYLRDQARHAYQSAIELDPKCLAAYTGLATLYQDMGEFDRAVQTYDKGLKLQPKNAELWFKYGMCQARHKDYLAACDTLKTATQLEPENKRYLNSLGFCLGMAGRYEECYAYFARETGEAKAHYNVARMLHHVNRDDEARKHLALALQANPQYREARTLLAELEKVDGTNKDVVPVSQETRGDASK